MKLDLVNTISNFFKKEEADCVIADIGAGLVKAIYCKAGQPEKFFIEKNKGEPLKILAAGLDKEKLSSKDLRLAIKGQDTLIRYIPFPKVDKKNIKEIIGYEIAKFIPFNKDDVYFDVCVLDDNYSSSEFFILLAVVKKDFLDGIMKSCEAAKLNLTEVTLNNICLINLFNKYETYDSNAAIIDVGFGSALLNIVKKNMPCLSREIKISCSDFFQRVAKIKNINAEEAENFIINSEEKAPVIEVEEIIEIIEEVVLGLCEEIKNSLDYFEVNWGQRVQSIYLTGGLTKIKGIDNIMFNSLGIETKIWDVFKGFSFITQDSTHLYKEMLAVPLGLTL